MWWSMGLPPPENKPPEGEEDDNRGYIMFGWVLILLGLELLCFAGFLIWAYFI